MIIPVLKFDFIHVSYYFITKIIYLVVFFKVLLLKYVYICFFVLNADKNLYAEFDGSFTREKL